MVLGVNDILCEWLRFRRSCVTRSIQYDIEKKSEKLNLLEGLEKILLDIDKAIKIVRETEEDAMVVPNLMEGFGISQIQAEFVAEIKLRNLNKEYILKKTSEIESLKSEIETLKATVSSKTKINKIIEKQLKDVSKKYGEDRKTTLISAKDAVVDIEPEELVPDFPVKLFRTKEGYIKKISLVALRTSGEQKLKDEDVLLEEVETTNRAEVIFFGGGSAYKMKVADIPDSKASLLGEYIPNLVGMEEKSDIIGMVLAGDYSGNLLFVFDNGKCAKVPLSAYATKSNRRRLTGAYSVKAEAIAMFYLSEDRDIVLISDAEKALCVNTEKIPLKTTRTTQGIGVMTLRRNAKVIGASYAENSGFADPKRYRPRNVPAAGSAIKDEDKGIEQMSLF